VLVRVATLIAAAVGAAAIGIASPAYAGRPDCPPGDYQAASGDCVPDPKKDLRIGRPPLSAKTGTTRIANTHTQVVPATATAALHKC
jgi:hypothetical protein